jgi:hypothetical protein
MANIYSTVPRPEGYISMQNEPHFAAMAGEPGGSGGTFT